MRRTINLAARTLFIAIATTSVGTVGCGGSQNRVITETEEYSFEQVTELAKQDLEQSESYEADEEE